MEHPNERIKEVRRILRLSQAEFAEKLNITQANVSQLENGFIVNGERVQKQISGKVIESMKASFPNINLAYIFTGETPIVLDPKARELSNAKKSDDSQRIVDSYEMIIKNLHSQIEELKADKAFLRQLLSGGKDN